MFYTNVCSPVKPCQTSPVAKKAKTKTEPAGVSAWLHQVLLQLQEALRGPGGPTGPMGPGA